MSEKYSEVTKNMISGLRQETPENAQNQKNKKNKKVDDESEILDG